MLDPYTMQRLNAERLKDVDRASAGLMLSRLARRNRRKALTAARLRLTAMLIGTGERIQRAVDHHRPRTSHK
jgi:hypothetical protein